MICANDMYNMNLRQAIVSVIWIISASSCLLFKFKPCLVYQNLLGCPLLRKCFFLWFSFKQIAWDPREAKAKNTFYPKEIDHFVVAFF